MYNFYKVTNETLHLKELSEMSKGELIESINAELDNIIEISNNIPSNPTRDMGFDLKQIDETIHYARKRLNENPMITVSAMDKIAMMIREYGKMPYRDFTKARINIIKLADELKDKMVESKKRRRF